jgi:hypothetical protein
VACRTNTQQGVAQLRSVASRVSVAGVYDRAVARATSVTARMKASRVAFHAKLDIVDTLDETYRRTRL